MNIKKLFATLSAMVVAVTMSMPSVTVFGANYSEELQGAYNWAHDKGVTTMSTIDNANMYGAITRAEMAKMLSVYATTVLEPAKKADTSKACTFTDIDSVKGDLHDYIIESCQLGIMGQNITAFRPYDTISRAEFGTALSRLLYGSKYEGGTPYYANHLQALKADGIMNQIANAESTKEVRGYVMLMLQRSDEGAAGTVEESEKLVACLEKCGSDTACVGECYLEEEEDNTAEEEEPVEGRTEQGLLAVSEASVQPSTTAPAWVPAIEIGTLKLTAWDEDVNLYSVSLEAMGTTAFASITDVALQNKDGVKVTRTKDVSNKWEVKVSFVNGYKLAAGSSETLTVIATIGGALNGDTVSFKVTDFEGPEKVDGTPITTQYVSIITNTNLWDLTVKANTADTTKVKLGEEATLWRFSVKPTNKNEDLVIKSITVEQYGNIKTSYLDDLYLTVDGKKVSTDYYIDRNDIVFTTNIELDKTDTSDIDVLVKGTVVDGLGNNVRLRINEPGDVIVEWQKYESRVNVSWLWAAITLSAAAINVQWTEISVSFDKTDTTSTLATSKANFGTLKLKAESSDYSFNKMFLELTATDGTAACPTAPITLAKYGIVDVTLWWDSYNGTPAIAVACAAWVTTFAIEFDDVDMDQGVSRNLPLVVELEDATAGNKYQFNININDDETLEDVTNDATYTSTADAAAMNKLLSATAFTTRIMTVEAGWLNISVTTLKKQNVVLANGKEVTVGMGQFKVTNVEDATLKSLKVAATADYEDVNGNALSLEDVASKAYLVVDGKSYQWEILVNNITFSDDAIKLAKGSTTDFEIQLVMKKKDVKDKVAAGRTNISTFNIATYTYKVWDTTVSPTPATSLWGGFEIVTIWTLTADADVTDNTATIALNYTNVDKTVLAGAKDVVLWRFKFNATQEDIKVTKAEFTITDPTFTDYNIKDSLANVRLATEDGKAVSATFTTTEDGDKVWDLTFDDMSYVAKKWTSQYLYLVADVNAIDQTDAWLTEAKKIDVIAELTSLTAIWESSNDDIVATLPWATSKVTSVRANVPATIELVPVNLTLWDAVLVWKVKITMADQSANKDNEWVLKAVLNTLNVTVKGVWASTTATLTGYRLEGSSAAIAATVPATDAELTPGQTVTYNVYADVASTADTPRVQVSVSDVNTEIVIDDQATAGAATPLNIGNGVTPEMSVTSSM